MTGFVFTLALALHLPLGEVLAMPYPEFNCWTRRYVEQPFGDVRADVRSALVAATVANSVRTKTSAAVKVTDYMPFLKSRRVQTDEEIEAGFRAMTEGR